MRASSSRRLLVLVALASAGGCSARPIVAVDPYPCAGDGATGCGPGLLDGLVGYWRLDDGPGSATARDWSSWGNDGTLVDLDRAGAWVAGGPESTALAVQGKGHVEVADSSSLDSITNQMTVAAWIYLEHANTDFATAISRQIGSGFGQLYHLSINPMQQPALYVTTPSQLVYLTDSAAAPLGAWVHVAGTWDGAEARLYVGGIQVARAPVAGAFAAESNPLVLAGNANGPDGKVAELVPGRLADVMLYRRALAPDAVARLAAGALWPAAAVGPAGGGR